jgi:TPR repeat protein
MFETMLICLLLVQNSGNVSSVLENAQGITFKNTEISTILQEIEGKDNPTLTADGVDMVQGKNGKQVDHRRAVAYFLIAASRGDLDAQARLGYMYHQGLGVVLSYAEAARWVKKAAEAGYAKAQYNLGLMYGNGQGVALDTVLALQWLKKAARQDYKEAQQVLKDMEETW